MSPPDRALEPETAVDGPGHPTSMNAAQPARCGARRPRVARVALLLALLLALIVVGSLHYGPTGAWSSARTLRGLAAHLGLAQPLEGHDQVILALRVNRVLVAVGVGAALALAGALLQGVFRNDLAAPSILGVTAGAGLGAALAVLAVGGFGPLAMLSGAADWAPALVSAMAFLGAMLATLVVTAVATTGGRISVPTLLLVGIAVNAVAGGCLAGVQYWVLQDLDLARAMLAWTFGSLDDRLGYHVWLVFGGLGLAAAVIPLVSLELDLFASGEEDARAAGVDTQRVKLLALSASALAAAVAVAVAGQIGFLGLVVPHLLRLAVTRSNRALLPLCLLAGPVVLLGADLAQRLCMDGSALRPGVVTSLLGGPFFLFLIVRNRARLSTW